MSYMSARMPFISFEGGEGCGKSTQVEMLAKRIEAMGLQLCLIREPGSTAIGERIRSILLDPASCGMDATCELLLYEAARAQMVEELLRPALDAGKVVICDRYSDSTMAYQGFARGLGKEAVLSVDALATRGLVPDRTILLQRPTQQALSSARTKGADRLENESQEFHDKVYEAFEQIAADEPQRIRKVEVSGDIEQTAALIWAELEDLFEGLDEGLNK